MSIPAATLTTTNTATVPAVVAAGAYVGVSAVLCWVSGPAAPGLPDVLGVLSVLGVVLSTSPAPGTAVYGEAAAWLGAAAVGLKVAGYVCCERRGASSDCVGDGIDSDVDVS